MIIVMCRLGIRIGIQIDLMASALKFHDCKSGKWNEASRLRHTLSKCGDIIQRVAIRSICHHLSYVIPNECLHSGELLLDGDVLNHHRMRIECTQRQYCRMIWILSNSTSRIRKSSLISTIPILDYSHKAIQFVTTIWLAGRATVTDNMNWLQNMVRWSDIESLLAVSYPCRCYMASLICNAGTKHKESHHHYGMMNLWNDSKRLDNFGISFETRWKLFG